jgi:predicted nucleotidyltransferase
MNAKKKKGTIVDRLAPDAVTMLKEKILERFSEHTMAITKSLDMNTKKEAINVIIDDSDSHKLSKQELQEKIDIILKEQISDTTIECNAILTSTIVQECKDSSYNTLQKLIQSTVLYDAGIMEALKSMWMHKELVLQKLEKYVVAYVVAGSIIKGVANPKSDMDSYIIVDDTDVKRMTRMELQEKLRGIIYTIARDVESETGIKRKIHPQVWLLTDYWENIKEANPVMMTMLRDCIPIYDRGIFMPWKNLLDMGRIKPSTEAINMYIDSGEQMYARVNSRLLDIVMEDLCLGLLYPSQALVMLVGEHPPSPKDAVEKMRELFVKKYKILEEKDLDVLSLAIHMRKGIEYGDIRQIDGKKLQEMMDNGKKYLEKIRDAYKKIEENNHKKETSLSASSKED